VPLFNRNNLLKSIDRRSFLIRAGLVCGGIALQRCVNKVTGRKPEYAHIKGKLSGPDHRSGHLIRDNSTLPDPTTERTVKTLIIGSGISGLSAARWLKKNGHDDFELIELENHTGGNAFFGSNDVSKYPLGAHYIPIVNNEDQLIVDFLHEHEVITHFDEKGLPYYNEYYLCFDPEERLLINGEWQEGLVPDFGVPDEDKKQIKRFFELVNKLKSQKGNDGKYLFNLPISESSADEQYRKLDKISFHDYLSQNGFTSPYLQWYLNYCCKDDYGSPAKDVSAWAGLHYFASRRGTAANAEANAVITWPEGNGKLVGFLKSMVNDHIRLGQMAYEVLPGDEKVIVKVYDHIKQQTTKIISDKVIMASPQFVNQRILKDVQRPGVDYHDMHYGTWLIANLTIDGLPIAKGMPLCWDNVAYGTPSVGYVNANNQDINLREHKKVLTYYLPLTGTDPRVTRLAAYARSYEQWLDIILPEMEKYHPGITSHISEAELWLWGHGMVRPSVSYIWGNTRDNALKSVGDKIFFAHTDLSGISVFEEAFHQGIRAANEVLKS
jgi:phytoene dehydrogenase-like protein